MRVGCVCLLHDALSALHGAYGTLCTCVHSSCARHVALPYSCRQHIAFHMGPRASLHLPSGSPLRLPCLFVQWPAPRQWGGFLSEIYISHIPTTMRGGPVSPLIGAIKCSLSSIWAPEYVADRVHTLKRRPMLHIHVCLLARQDYYNINPRV